MTIARYYDASKNPEGAYLPGVPLRDLTDADLARLPEHLRVSVDASPLYRRTKPKAPPDDPPVSRAKKRTARPAALPPPAAPLLLPAAAPPDEDD